MSGSFAWVCIYILDEGHYSFPDADADAGTDGLALNVYNTILFWGTPGHFFPYLGIKKIGSIRLPHVRLNFCYLIKFWVDDPWQHFSVAILASLKSRPSIQRHSTILIKYSPKPLISWETLAACASVRSPIGVALSMYLSIRYLATGPLPLGLVIRRGTKRSNWEAERGISYIG